MRYKNTTLMSVLCSLSMSQQVMCILSPSADVELNVQEDNCLTFFCHHNLALTAG